MKYPEVSKRFRTILSIRKLRQQDLAEKTGIGKASISQYVNGSHCPSNDKAAVIGDALNVNYLWLMGFDVPMEKEVESTISKGVEEERLKKFTNYYMQLNESERVLIDNMITTLLSKQ